MDDDNFECQREEGSLKVKISLSKNNVKMDNPEDEDVQISTRQNQIYLTIKEIHKLIIKKDPMNIFAEPVTDEIAPGYSQIITNPIDLSKIYQNICKKTYYKTICEYVNDLILMCNNCMTYNTPDTIFYQKANQMLSFIRKQLTLSKINKLRTTIGYTNNLDSIDFGEYKSSSCSSHGSKRSTSPSSSECSEEMRAKKRPKSNSSLCADLVHDKSHVASFDVEKVSQDSDVKPQELQKPTKNSPLIQPQPLKNPYIRPPKAITPSTPIVKDDIIESDGEEVNLEDIKSAHREILVKMGDKKPTLCYLSKEKNELLANSLDGTIEDEKVYYSKFITTCLAERSYKKAFESLQPATIEYLEKINALETLNMTPKEPIACNIHGPLKVFSEDQLSNLLSIYGGDGQCLEYVLSLLRFANPIGPWALNSCDDKLNSVTDGLHSSLASYILEDDELNILSDHDDGLLKLLI